MEPTELKSRSVGRSGAHLPGTHAREKNEATAASSCSMIGCGPVQSGRISRSAINCKHNNKTITNITKY